MANTPNPLIFQDQQRLLLKLAEKVKVFQGMSTAEIEELLSNAEKCSYAAGADIVIEGSSGQHFYLLINGSAVVTKRGQEGNAELARLGPADSFGEMALIDQTERSATVSATSDCIALRLTASSIGTHPALAAKLYRNICRVLTARLRDADEMLAWRI